MPKRRLPRTEEQRTVAMSTCHTKYQATAAPARLISAEQFTLLGTALGPWRAACDAVGPLLAAQATATGRSTAGLRECAQANSHFIQVLNLAIERGKVPASARAYYELPVSHAEVPPMTSAVDALLWAARLANGEAKRVAAGGPAMGWPGISEVNAAATALQTAATAQSAAKDAYDLGQEAVSSQRAGVDALIKDLWDTMEYNLRAEEPPSLRRKAREWGVVYEGDEAAEPEPTPHEPPGP